MLNMRIGEDDDCDAGRGERKRDLCVVDVLAVFSPPGFHTSGTE